MTKHVCSRRNYRLLPQLLALMLIIQLSVQGCISEKNAQSNTPTIKITLQPDVQLSAPIPPETGLSATPTAVPQMGVESLPVQSLDAAATASLVEQGYDLESEAGLRAALAEFFSNPNYSQIQIPDSIKNKWLDFSRAESELTIEEKLDLAQFLDQWLQLDALIKKSEYGRTHLIQFKAQVLENSEGRSLIKPYLVVLEDGLETPLLLARDEKGKFIDLVPAPHIPGFTLRAAEDGWHFEYLDDRGKVMLIADAYPLVEADILRIKKEIEADKLSEEDPLMTRLVQVFLDQKENGSLSVPKYRLPEEGIELNLIGIDKSLSASQIILLNEAFELFDRPEFEALKESLFGSDIWMFFFDDLGQASGMNYTGTGLIMIDRRDLFGNRYILASVLAHEAAHVLQGGVRNSDDRCQELLNMEIGNGKIAKDFSSWTADQVISGIKDRQLGAYHISLWVLRRLGYQNLNTLEQAILTGRIEGTSVLLDCP